MRFRIAISLYGAAVVMAISGITLSLNGFNVWSGMFNVLSLMALHNFPRGTK